MTLVTRGFRRAANTSEIVAPIEMPTIVAWLISTLSRYAAVHWVEILGRVCGFWNIRPAVPGIVKGMDREVLLELGNDFLEYVELGSERMQENEVRARPSLDAADSYAIEIHIFDGNPGGPDQCFGPLRGRPQGFDDVGEYDQHNEECQDGNQYPGHVYGAILQLTWPRQQAVARQ